MQHFHKKIIIKFINLMTESNIDSFRMFLPEEGRDFLKKEIVFSYTDNTVIKDLFVWIVSNIEPELPRNDNYLIGKILGICDHCREHLYLYFPLQKYIDLHAENNTLLFDYQLCVGGAARIDGLVKIWIRSRESVHKGYPHIHLSLPNDKVARVSFSLADMKPVTDKDKEEYDRIFTRNQRSEIETIIGDHKNYLKQYYESIQMGSASIQTFKIGYNDKSYKFH